MSGSDDPFAELDRLFDRLTEGFDAGGPADLVPVSVDVVEADDAVVVTADLPGYAPGDIDVTVDGRTLSIRADRDEHEEETEGRYVRRERRHRATSRSVSLPTDVVEAEATATYENGVLTVRLPTGAGDGHRIEVE
ncbi:MAG: Hsp20/alpha crystallin family protein [Haloferacaceae archaeon]